VFTFVPDMSYLVWTRLVPFVLREKIRTTEQTSVPVSACIFVVFFSEERINIYTSVYSL
jgi:hypothetical protein